MLFNSKFDLVLSLGEDCACSGWLRRFKLQNFSYPFDWLTSASFENRIELILNNFSNFLNKEDLYPIEKPKAGPVDEKCDYWADKRYNFYFYHDFLREEPFETEYLKVKEKYKRRIKRLYEQISNKKTILFVWWSRDKHQNIGQVQESYRKLCQKFSAQSVYLLLIEYAQEEEKVFLANNHILISRFDNVSYKHNKNWNETTGNETNNVKIFSQIKISRTLGWYIKYTLYRFLKLLVAIIPIKNVRKKMRHELNAKFYKEAL